MLYRTLFSTLAIAGIALLSPTTALHGQARTESRTAGGEVGPLNNAAQSRVRRWDCRVTKEELAEAAARAFARLLPDTAEAYREFAAEFEIPTEARAFTREFRVVAEPDRCRTLGEALERQGYALPNRMRAFRIGRVYFVPAVDAGIIVGLDGEVIGGFRAPAGDR